MPAIGVFGAGWVGLVTGACLAELGHEVVIRDVLPERIEALQAGRVPLHEPGLDELLERNRERLTFTIELEEVVSAQIMFVCVGTPPMYSGDADLSAVWSVVDELPAVWSVVDELPALEERAILVMKSTVPVGTGEKVRAALDARKLAHVGYVSNPEFLSEGSAVDDFMKPDRIVVGAFTEADAGLVASLYEPLGAPVVRADVASAEMIKLAANAFLMTRISFINEIANVCEATGADVEQVAKGVGLDHRLGPHFLRAGIGWGGSCFPKDGMALKQLASNSGYHFQLLSAVIEVNELQKRRVVGKLEKHLGKLGGKTVALLGLAFKPNTDDLREAPSLVLASRLLAEGADVRAWDPVADASSVLQGVTFCESVLDAVSGADAAVVVTEWDELKGLASEDVRQAMRRPVIVDGRNLLDPEQARSAGFLYEGIGRAAWPLASLPETEEREPQLEA
jgi:UDPglucose 6-dehydrogenase